MDILLGRGGVRGAAVRREQVASSSGRRCCQSIVQKVWRIVSVLLSAKVTLQSASVGRSSEAWVG